MAQVLLVDDDDDSRLSLTAYLEVQGFSVDTVDSCAAARERLATQTYAVVLVDQQLRDGLGTELVPLVRTRSGTRVVLVSGSEVPASAALVDATFQKGASPAELVARLRTWVPRG